MVNFVFAPTIAQLHAQGEHAELQSAVTTTGWWATVGAVAVGLPLFLLPGFFLALFGEGFVAGETALRIILLASLVNAATGSVGYLMTMTGLERQATVLTATAALINVALAFLLIPPFGLVGAALAAAAGVVVWNVMAVVWSWRRLGIVAGIFASVLR
jgi:O-antigen/teichoic acid export membrane protein